MTREEARKKAEIMLAYADGKEIEFRDSFESEWTSIDNPSFDSHADCYRIKQEPKYRPFQDADECWEEMKKHKLFGWLKSKSGDYKFINSVNFASVNSNDYYYTYKQAFDDFTFIDGTPFGIKEG